MSIVRFDPFREMAALQERVNRAFGASKPQRKVGERTAQAATAETAAAEPPIVSPSLAPAAPRTPPPSNAPRGRAGLFARLTEIVFGGR